MFNGANWVREFLVAEVSARKWVRDAIHGTVGCRMWHKLVMSRSYLAHNNLGKYEALERLLNPTDVLLHAINSGC